MNPTTASDKGVSVTNPSNRELIEEMRWQVSKIRNKQAENAELLDKLDAVKDRLAALEASATSPDGMVTVVAGAGGIVRSVTLDDAAMRSSASSLSAAINDTIRDAIAMATRHQLEIVRADVGDSVDVQQILGPQAKFADYGTPRPAAQAPAPDVTDYDDEPFDTIFRAR